MPTVAHHFRRMRMRACHTALPRGVALAVVLGASVVLPYTPLAAVPTFTSAKCATLAHLSVSAGQIALPTGGANVTGTQMVSASGSGATAVAEHCLVSGRILPHDPKAPDIQFRIALPTTWNSKILMLGGGGFDGSIPNITGNILNTTPDALSPLARGYSVFASDSGHQAQAANALFDASFALNAEAYRNWMGDALKKTRDSVVIIVKAAYGKSASRAYFVGGSTGGRESLSAAGGWPSDWDGIVALYPSASVTATILGLVAMDQAFAGPGAYLNPAKRGVLRRAALAACDSLDGARDGVISNVRGCNAVFEPASAQVDGGPLRCAAGADTGDTCLSDAQLSALHTVNSPIPLHVALATGQTSLPGYNIYTSDPGIPSDSPYERVVTAAGMGSAAPGFPVTSLMSLSALLVDNYFRFAVSANPSFNYLTFEVANVGAYASRIIELSTLELVSANLARFGAKGGRVLLMQGTEDLLVSPRSTELYFTHLQAILGAAKVAAFLRFYEVPGFGHAVSTTFNASWDQLTALEKWVERGIDPANHQIVMDSVGVPGRTRPLCPYPSWPKYTGSGDMNNAASFTCAAQ